MAVLLIKCPHTDRPVSTGIELDAETFAKLPDILSYMKCPECGLEHAWWTREAGWKTEWKFHRLRTKRHKGAIGQLRGERTALTPEGSSRA
jgi:hypothetical protein